MFYRPADGHGLPHNPFTAIVAPRPIGWISTRGPLGDNLAPYSFFNAVAYRPPQVMFASTGLKDTLAAIRATGVFAVNIVAQAMLQVMSDTSATFPRGTDEFTACGIAKGQCNTIDAPFVTGAPAVLECRATREVTLDGRDNIVTFGEVTGIHIDDACLKDGLLDLTRYRPAARLGYHDYTTVDRILTLRRPDGD